MGSLGGVCAARSASAAKPAVLDAAEDALGTCLSGGGRIVRCTGGAIALSADELGLTHDWSLQGKITVTRDPKINLRYEVRAQVVAAGTDTSGTTAKQGFTWEATCPYATSPPQRDSLSALVQGHTGPLR